jgi:very-short-patch-repair endonuclease
MSMHGRWMAAVLAYGSDALLSHRDAGALFGIHPLSGTQVDVTVVGRRRHSQRGIAVHLPRRLHQDDRAIRDGIPVTSVSRTLLDLAKVLRPRQLARALEEAERLDLFDRSSIQQLIDRSHGHHGLGRLNEALRNYREPPPTRLALERRFFDLCRDAGLPRPQVNVLVAGCEVDAVWLDRALVVELDSRTYHQTRAAFERDRERDAHLQSAGYRVIRLTHRRLERRPAEVIDLVRLLLSRWPERPGGAPGAGRRVLRGGPAW